MNQGKFVLKTIGNWIGNWVILQWRILSSYEFTANVFNVRSVVFGSVCLGQCLHHYADFARHFAGQFSDNSFDLRSLQSIWSSSDYESKFEYWRSTFGLNIQ